MAVLGSVGPAQLMAQMRRAGIDVRLPTSGPPGLAVGFGGVGMTLRNLVTLYAAIARGGEPVKLYERFNAAHKPFRSKLLSAEAAWQVGDILANAPSPDNAIDEPLAFKTGTSYGHRDAWAIRYDGRRVIGVWIGRADNSSASGVLGIDTAAPLLFEAFNRLKRTPDALAPPPSAVLTHNHAELPVPLRHLRHRAVIRRDGVSEPEIAFTPNGACVDLGISQGHATPLTLKV